MLKKILSILGVVIALIFWTIGGKIGQEIGQEVSKSSLTKEELQLELLKGFEKAAKQINATTPMIIDKETRLDRVIAGPGALITYNSTLLNYTASQIDSTWLQINLRNSVKNSVCTNKEMKKSLEYGGKYKYSYSGKDRQLIGSFIIDGNDCGYIIKIP